MNKKNNLMSWYSELYPYAFGLTLLTSLADMYNMSKGNLSNNHALFLLWALSLIIGLTSLSCQKILERKNIRDKDE